MLLPTAEKDKTYSVGIDASLTSLGVYCNPFSGLDWFGWTLKTTPKDGSDTKRVMAITDSLLNDLRGLPISVITFEDYGPINRMAGKVAQRAEICGIIKFFALTELRVPVITSPPTALKKYATDNGRASKENMLTEAAKYGYYPDTDDEADAFFASRLGMDVVNSCKVGVSYSVTLPDR